MVSGISIPMFLKLCLLRRARRQNVAPHGGFGTGFCALIGLNGRSKPMFLPGPPPVARAPEGSLYVTPVGHATFLIQMDGVNILTDPMWSERCSPVSWVGPKRYSEPGIRFEDLPPIDVVLVSHNHYDHFDLPTLEGLAKKGMPRAIVPLGNLDLMRSTGIATVDELDWWQSVRLSSNVTITLVPAQHFSARTLWDRDRTLWGGFVISGPSGNVYYCRRHGIWSPFP